MTTGNPSSRSTRLKIRVRNEQKNLIEPAAAYAGRTVADFVIAHVEVAAKQVIEEYERLRLNQEQSRVLAAALLAPKRPNKKLRRAVDEYRKRVESR